MKSILTAILRKEKDSSGVLCYFCNPNESNSENRPRWITRTIFLRFRFNGSKLLLSGGPWEQIIGKIE